MAMRLLSRGAACLLVVTVAGCTSPARYAATLSVQDAKWRSPRCEQIRTAALDYKDEKPISWAAGLLFPYGTGIVLAAKEHQEKQRKLFTRNMHMRCSSLPLPKRLQVKS